MADLNATIVVLMDRVLRSHFVGSSWHAWRTVLAALFGLPLTEQELDTFRRLTGRTAAPTAPATEAWLVCGRRSGKSMIAALIAVYCVTCRRYKLAPGERGVFMVVAADRKQARVVRRYIGGLLNSTPVLQQLIARETKEAIELTTDVSIEIHTASFRTVRGYTVVGAVLDEIAFWPTDEAAADPDREILAALRPAMATIPDALLLALSSPYARRGELYRVHKDHFGRDDDPVLVVQADTRALNPTVSQAFLDRAYAEDPASAAAEYGAQFRSDVETFISREAVADCLVKGRRELAPQFGTPVLVDGRHTSHPAFAYAAFVDPAGGSGTDSFTVAIAHAEQREGTRVAVIDAVRETRPPFSPAAVVQEYATLLKAYRVTVVFGDRWGGEWPREVFRRHGVDYRTAESTKSEIFRDALALLNSGRIELLDHERLIAQLVGLERRTARGGRDSIDHAPGNHDDVANVVCGVATRVTVAARPRAGVWSAESNRDGLITITRPDGTTRRTHALGDDEAERLAAGGTPKTIPWYERERMARFKSW